MHYRTLAVIDIPEIEPDIGTNCDKDSIGQLNRTRRDVNNAFTKEVHRRVNELFDPYNEGTDNPKYLKFKDITDNLKKVYENQTVNCVKLPDGRIVDAHKSVFFDKFIIRGGLVYQRCFGQLKHQKRSKAAKKITAIQNYPYKKLYKSFEDFVGQEELSYIRYDREHKRYGYVYNPNARYDCCCIGGLCPEMFLVKEECTEFIVGNCEYNDYAPIASKGYRWVTAARKKDIQWKEIRRYIFNEAISNYKKYREIFEMGVVPEEYGYFDIEENGLYADWDMLYQKGETLSEYLKRKGIKGRCKHVFAQFVNAYLQDGIFNDVDKFYQDNKDVGNTYEPWYSAIDEFYNSLDDNAVLVCVECHV